MNNLLKKCALLISLFYLLPSCPLHASEITANSQITKVAVYQDRALITREAELDLDEGPSEILFENLPAFIQEESLRAEGKGTAQVSIDSTEIKKFFQAEEVNPKIAEVTQMLEKLDYELRELQSKSNALQNQNEFLDSVKNFSSVQIPKEIITKNSTSADWAGLSQFMLDSYTDLGQKTLILNKAMADKNKEIQAKQQELNELRSGGRQTEKKTISVNVDAKTKGSFKILLSYVIPQAMWNISYDAKVYPDKKNCLLTSYGNIRQWTGEDWKEVALVLSSAKPAIGGHMPELSPWFVNFYDPMVYPSSAPMRRNKLMDTQETMADANMDSFQDKEENAPAAYKAVLAQASVNQELGAVTYEIKKKFTVLSDNRAVKVPIKSEDFKTDLDYEATPKLSPYAFIHSKVVNNKDYSIAGGSVNIFMNDNFIGQSSIKTIGRQESFDLYLGIDEELKVKRTEIIDKKKKTLLGLKAKQDFAYKFEIENYKPEKIKLTLIDQLPVSKNNDIKVDFVSSSIKPTETKDLGILKWVLDLSPKEKKELEFQFSVEYPADKNIVGI